jgi:ABC-type cobalamin transport system ATPase subunit
MGCRDSRVATRVTTHAGTVRTGTHVHMLRPRGRALSVAAGLSGLGCFVTASRGSFHEKNQVK